MYILFLIFSFEIVSFGGERWNFPRSARIFAMGEAGSALKKEIGSFIYNPASILMIDKREIQGTFSNFFAGLYNFTSLNSFFEFEDKGILLSFSYSYSDNILHTVYKDTIPAESPEEIEKKGNLKFLSYQLVFSFAKNFSFIKWGVNLRFFREEFGIGAGYGTGVDMGILIDKNVKISLSLRHILGDYVFWNSGAQEWIPPSLRFGIYYEPFHFLKTSFDLEIYGENRGTLFSYGIFSFAPYFGLEYVPKENVFIRLGWRENLPSMGAGVILFEKLKVDYAIFGNLTLQFSHIVSLSYIF
jgi:hypothetical protein